MFDDLGDLTDVPVHIILGSDSDLPVVHKSGMLDILMALKIPWELSVISAHRHPDPLRA